MRKRCGSVAVAAMAKAGTTVVTALVVPMSLAKRNSTARQ
jgi:hypothetical protein